MKILGRLSYVASAICVGTGLYKLFAYNNPDEKYSILSDDKAVNAYVGGDAYNYIINAGQATGYFVLAVFFAVVGGTAIIAEILKEKQNNYVSSENSLDQ